ncbi:hypothetical protein CDD83_259 [Cordyceps sp. RAO-2017]|nr:hypothetical protein CDD83_259 [Cordyceps sp. RAO-2017]
MAIVAFIPIVLATCRGRGYWKDNHTFVERYDCDWSGSGPICITGGSWQLGNSDRRGMVMVATTKEKDFSTICPENYGAEPIAADSPSWECCQDYGCACVVGHKDLWCYTRMSFTFLVLSPCTARDTMRDQCSLLGVWLQATSRGSAFLGYQEIVINSNKFNVLLTPLLCSQCQSNLDEPRH